MKFIIFVSLLIIAGVRSIPQNDSPTTTESPKGNLSKSGSSCDNQIGGSQMRFITPSLAYSGDAPFYHRENLTYVDRYDIARYCLDFKNGAFNSTVKETTEGLELAFAYPYANTYNMHVVGAGNEIRFELNEKIVGRGTITKDTGYVICKGHADANGRLYITMNSNVDKKHKGGRLYKYKKFRSILVKRFDKDIGDFVFNKNNTKFYLVTNNGFHITRYNYSNETQKFTDEKVIFKMPNTFTKRDWITGIEIDDYGKIYAIVKGGYLLKIDPKLGKIIRMTQLPTNYPTGITFGGPDCSGLIITTSKQCHFNVYNTGGVIYVTGLKTKGCCDSVVQ